MQKNDKIIYTLLNHLPQNFVSRTFGVISDIEFPSPLQKMVNQGFASLTSIDLTESERTPSEYHSLNDFFTRKLADHVHTIDVCDENSAVSPVDGRLDQFGHIDDGSLIQAKGRAYSVRSLLDSFDHASTFVNGSFATLYLSPRDYHRVHCAVDGTISEVSYIPGRLWPVKPWAVQHVEELFAVNERLISYIDTPSMGRVASVMVGATCVGRISLSFGEFCTNGNFRRREDSPVQPPIPIAKGDELGCFNLGSTVILLFEKRMAFAPEWKIGEPIRMGRFLAKLGASS